MFKDNTVKKELINESITLDNSIDEILIQHAWVKRIEHEGVVMFSAILKFPTLQNDTIHDTFMDKDFNVVKEWCEAELAKYIKQIKRLK